MESQANYFTTQAQLESKSQTRFSIAAIQKHREQHMCIHVIAWTPWLIKLDHWQINNRMTWLNQTASCIRSLHDPRIYKFTQAFNVSLTFSRTSPIHYIIGNNKNSRATQSSIKNGSSGGSRAGSTPSPPPSASWVLIDLTAHRRVKLHCRVALQRDKGPRISQAISLTRP